MTSTAGVAFAPSLSSAPPKPESSLSNGQMFRWRVENIQLKAQVAELSKVIEGLDYGALVASKMQEAVRVRNELQEKVDSLEKQRNELSTRLQTFGGEKEVLSAELRDSAEKITQLQGQILGLRTQLATSAAALQTANDTALQVIDQQIAQLSEMQERAQDRQMIARVAVMSLIAVPVVGWLSCFVAQVAICAPGETITDLQKQIDELKGRRVTLLGQGTSAPAPASATSSASSSGK